MKAIVLNGSSRNSLAIIRSLANQNFLIDTVVYISNDNTIDSYNLKYKSKYVKFIHFIERNQNEVNKIVSILKNEKYDFLFAGGTHQSNLISKHKIQFSKYTKVVSEDYSKVSLVHNKKRCGELIKSLGISVPSTFYAKNKNELVEITKKLKGKAIVKYADSYNSNGLVQFKGDEDKMIRDYIRIFGFDYLEDNFPLIQQMITGQLHDSTAFSVNGDTVAVLSQKRVMTSWLHGGGGIINMTTNENVIKNYTRLILKEINWNGHIEIDWIKDSITGEFYFIEINPKFWGTTQLTISAGYDFPFWNILMINGKEIKAIENYKVGLKYRWLEDEIVTIAKYSKGWEHLKNWLIFFIRFFSFKTKTSIYLRDIKPFIGFFKLNFLFVLITYYSKLKLSLKK